MTKERLSQQSRSGRTAGFVSSGSWSMTAPSMRTVVKAFARSAPVWRIAIPPLSGSVDMRFAASLLALVALATPLPLAAQLPIPVYLQAGLGIAVPRGDVAASEGGFSASTGPTFSIGARVHPIPSVGLFVQYEQSRFGCDDCTIVGLDDRAVLESIGGGMRYALPVPAFRLSPWVEGTLVRQTLGFSDGNHTLASDADFGFSAGAGVTIPIASRFAIEPGLRYLNMPANLEFELYPDRDVDVTAFTLDVGLAFRL
ncbi:MAG: outer membrane beta-barrel protein [Gemmatimonas sp.]|nr:outer membrane beta-barrel protein [Gemmatimonas sp.]